MTSPTNKKIAKSTSIAFESDDTEGSDLSYESSNDWEEDKNSGIANVMKVQLFKE
jgi:hypothetical protein